VVSFGVRSVLYTGTSTVYTHIPYDQFWSEISLIRLYHPRTYQYLANASSIHLIFVNDLLGDDASNGGGKVHDLSIASKLHIIIIGNRYVYTLNHCYPGRPFTYPKPCCLYVYNVI
jgi:hypothetical protein